MSIKFFDIILPVAVYEHDDAAGQNAPRVSPHKLTVRITMGPSATAKDAVDELARKIESTLNTVDIGDCT